MPRPPPPRALPPTKLDCDGCLADKVDDPQNSRDASAPVNGSGWTASASSSGLGDTSQAPRPAPPSTRTRNQHEHSVASLHKLSAGMEAVAMHSAERAQQVQLRSGPPPPAPPSVLKKQLEASHVQLARIRGETAAISQMSVTELVQLVEQTKVSLSRMEAALWVRQNEAVQNGMCMICMDRERDTVLVPCGHQTCGACATRLSSCAVCRQEIAQRVRTFRS